MSKPLELTTPSNGWAVGVYWLVAILGVSFFTPFNSSPAIRGALGRYGVTLWAASMALMGVLGLAAVTLSLTLPGPLERPLRRRQWSRAARLATVLKIERVGAAGAAFVGAVYVYALMRPHVELLQPGMPAEEVVKILSGTFTTKLLGMILVVGGVARAWQITKELRQWERARHPPKPATPPLAAPAQ